MASSNESKMMADWEDKMMADWEDKMMADWEDKMMADWADALAKIEAQSGNLLRKKVLGDGGIPRQNTIIFTVNHHALAALNALKGARE